MKVFISWSGKLSGSVAILLGKWLPNVIQAVTPFVSSEDIPKGTRWFEEIFKELKISNCGLICLTRDNVNKPWIAFEAGALLKSVDRSLVIPLLIDFPLNELKDHPLALFQAATFSKDDVYKIVCSINNNLGDRSLTESILEKSFEKWWPDLNEGVQKAVEESQAYLHLNKKLQEKFEEDFGLWNDFKGNHIMWPPEEFYSISEYYRKANQDLNDDKLAFLLTQAVQHGGNDFRYWVEKNHYNKRAVEYLIKALIKAQKEGWKRVGWRATFALQNIDSKIIDEFITKASEEIVHILQKIRSERVEDTLL